MASKAPESLRNTLSLSLARRRSPTFKLSLARITGIGRRRMETKVRMVFDYM